MGFVERKLRLKEKNKADILEGALTIGKTEGWQALSMRKIADMIEYTAPAIYEYFPAGKDAILLELARIGFLLLGKRLKETGSNAIDPAISIEKMWLAYWEFAFEEKALYQLMFGINVACGADKKLVESEHPDQLFKAAIRQLYTAEIPSDQEIAAKYYTYWSVVHGLISINMVNKGNSELVNKEILLQSIHAINQSISG
jgi:AcrR family transcriptional regulator